MGIGKEQIIIFEKYAKKQVRLYEDACDYGFIPDEKAKKELRFAVKEMKELGDGWKSKAENYSTGQSWHCEGRVLLEADDNHPGKYCGYLLSLDYVKNFKDTKVPEFFTVSVKYATNLPLYI